MMASKEDVCCPFEGDCIKVTGGPCSRFADLWYFERHNICYFVSPSASPSIEQINIFLKYTINLKLYPRVAPCSTLGCRKCKLLRLSIRLDQIRSHRGQIRNEPNFLGKIRGIRRRATKKYTKVNFDIVDRESKSSRPFFRIKNGYLESVQLSRVRQDCQ